MKVEDEKKLVAEKLMGWKVGKRPPFPDTVLIYRIGCFPDTNVNVLEPEHWNPQTDRNAWDEIWEKLRFYTRENEICANTYLDFVFPVGNAEKGTWLFDLHTAKPAQCWKALIKTLGLE